MRSFAVVSIVLVSIAAARAETIEVKVKRNQTATIGGHASYTKDGCRPMAYAGARIAKKPDHGIAQVVTGTFALGPNAGVCAGARVPGAGVSYTPAKGFVGTDEIEFAVPFEIYDGEATFTELKTTYHITVE